MGGKSKSHQSQSSTQTNMPPSWAKPLFEQGAEDAQNIYNSGKGGNVYQGKWVNDLSNATQNGLQGLGQAANEFSNSGLQQQLGKTTSSQSNLSDMASGKYLSEGNPYYKERLNQEVGDMAAKVNSQMSGAGRYGSGANSNVLAKNTSSMMLSGLENDYNRAMQNMITANGQIDNANQGAMNSAGNYLNNWSNAANSQLQGGRVVDANEQAKLDAERQKWEAEDNKDWTRLGYLLNAASGTAGNYGTQHTEGSSTTTNSKNPWDVAGSVAGLTRKSDRRLKEDIVPQGTKNGFPIYSFSYKGESEQWLGVMAQDILELKPEAVFKDKEDGFYRVDYAQLGFSPIKIENPKKEK